MQTYKLILHLFISIIGISYVIVNYSKFEFMNLRLLYKPS